MKTTRQTYRIGAKRQHKSRLTRTTNAPECEDDIAAMFSELPSGSPEATLGRIAAFFRTWLVAQGWPEGKNPDDLTSAEQAVFCGDNLGKAKAVSALGDCLDAIAKNEAGDYRAALQFTCFAFNSGILATYAMFERDILAGKTRTGEGAAAKTSKSDRLKEKVRPEWDRLLQAGKSANSAAPIIAKMKDETGELFAEGRKAGTIRRWFEEDALK
jgi:hypothetical protein